MFQAIVESRAPDEESHQAYTSLMIRVIGERDIGACETCYLLHGIPLYQCTRTFRILVITIGFKTASYKKKLIKHSKHCHGGIQNSAIFLWTYCSPLTISCVTFTCFVGRGYITMISIPFF